MRTNDSISDGSDVKIVRVNTATRALTPIAGREGAGGCFCNSPDDEPAGATMIESNSYGVVELPDGRIVYGDGRHQVRVIEPVLPGFGAETLDRSPRPSGDEVYVFDSHGRHLRTLDGITGVKRLEFSYDAERPARRDRRRRRPDDAIERAADGHAVGDRRARRRAHDAQRSTARGGSSASPTRRAERPSSVTPRAECCRRSRCPGARRPSSPTTPTAGWSATSRRPAPCRRSRAPRRRSPPRSR